MADTKNSDNDLEKITDDTVSVETTDTVNGDSVSAEIPEVVETEQDTDAVVTLAEPGQEDAEVADPVEDLPADEIETDTVTVAEDEGEPENQPDEPAPSASADTVAETADESGEGSKGGFMPMLLGGVAAGLIGFGIGQYTNGGWPFATNEAEDPFRLETTASIIEHTEALSRLSNRVNAIEGAVDGIDASQISKIPSLESALASRPDLSPRIAQLGERLSALESKVEELEKRPVEATVSPEAIAAYERELENLRLAMEGQRAEIETMAKDAVKAEQNAESQALLAQGRTALAEITAALETGAPFASALERLHQAGFATPSALAATATDGVPTQAILIESFPPAARDALAIDRAAETDNATGAGRIGAFFRETLNVRSVTPREGDSADAILSRAEDALKNGRLGDALAGLDALPEASKAAMSDWSVFAGTRLAALNAAEALAQELNSK